MTCYKHFSTPLGPIILAADEIGLVGLWFEGQKYEKAGLPKDAKEGDSPVFHETLDWLAAYLSGNVLPLPPLHLKGTAFRKKVWEALLTIPYGETMSYSALAVKLGMGEGAAQSVGGAVGHNPISILVPCHRVIGADGELLGYAGGLNRKKMLLHMEKSLSVHNS